MMGMILRMNDSDGDDSQDELIVMKMILRMN